MGAQFANPLATAGPPVMGGFARVRGPRIPENSQSALEDSRSIHVVRAAICLGLGLL